MTNEARANRPAATSQMVACAGVTLALLFVAVAVVGTLAAEDRPNGERPPQPVAQSSDSRDDVSATPPAHPTAGKRNGKLLPVCAYEVAAIIQGPTPPAVATRVTAVNENGWVAGFWSGISNLDRAFYWRPEFGQNVYTIPLPPGYNRSFANDLNDMGLVVGSMQGPGLASRGFVFDTNTEEMVTILDPIDPDGSSSACWANAINNDGIVVGARSIGETWQPYNAFIWTPGPPEEGGGTYEDLGVMNGNNSSAMDVNEIGSVTGWTGNDFFTANAMGFFYRNGQLEFIDPVPEGYQSSSRGLNIVDEATGDSRISSDQGNLPHAFHWMEGVTLKLENLPGFKMSFGRSINDESVIVGTCRPDNSSNDRACLWYAGEVYDINDFLEPQQPPVIFRNARAIAQNGAIAGNTVQSNKQVGVLLTPIERPLGDLTGDCAVGVDDLVFLLSEWGKTESPADLNKDGLVDGADLGILLSNWTMP